MMTMMTFDTDVPQQCGIIEADAEGLVCGFHEKVQHPPGNRANAAVYIFEPELLQRLEALGKVEIDLSTELLPSLLGRISTFHNLDYHRDIGTTESLARAHEEFRPA